MPIFDAVKSLCAKLDANSGWKGLFARHGLNLSAADLAGELQKALSADRTLLGFEDFAEDGIRAIESGSPSRSLLYHALASPNVLNAEDGTPLNLFATPAELDALENYIFGVNAPTLSDVQSRFPGGSFGVVVFAVEYRPASQTTHNRHADMVYSRTGVARVGNRSPRYVPELRGFHPEVPTDPFAFAVCPARYAAYLSVRLPGSAANARPLRPQSGDNSRQFWIPVHKLFPGDECLSGLTLSVGFNSSHVNEKIFRAQKLLGLTPPNAPPHRITSNLAELSTDPAFGPGWVIPTVHPRFVEPAKTTAGQDVTYPVPANPGGSWATIDLWQISGTQSGPEYLHARTERLANGSHVNLNNSDSPPVDDRVRQGGYQALHYVDFTADGQVQVDCPQVQGNSGVAANAVAAYSLVAAPDFYPAAGQRELTEWVQSNAVPAGLRAQIWSTRPAPLSDVRLPANLQLPSSSFQAADTTITAVVGLPIPASTSPKPDLLPALRHSHFPDDAAGVFFPGWDVSTDTNTAGVEHLAAYGLGSPFPEDSKLCAALSTFWPAVAPDVTRTMDTAQGANLSGTVAPLTDAEIGRTGGLPWDGVVGPREINVAGSPFAEYESFLHADYVRNSLDNKFTLRLLSKVDFQEYTDRILGLVFGYLALGVERTSAAANPALTNLRGERRQWILLSFRGLLPGDGELVQAGIDTGVSLATRTYRASVFRATNNAGAPIPFVKPTDFFKRRIPITGRMELILAPAEKIVLMRKAADTVWRLGIVQLV